MKILPGVLICLFLASCASSSKIRTQPQNEREIFYENQTLDDVWNGCMKTLNEMGCIIRESDKDKGLISADLDRLLEAEASPKNFKWAILISEKQGVVTVACRVTTSRSTVMASKRQTEKAELERFLHMLNENLKNSK